MEDLDAMGFRGAVAPVSAAQVGAPHERNRWWLLAHVDDARQPALAKHDEVARLQEAAESHWRAGPGRVLGMDVPTPNRVDRLRALGNGVVPQQAAEAFRILWHRLAD